MHICNKHLKREHKMNSRNISEKMLLKLILQLKGMRFECMWFSVGIGFEAPVYRVIILQVPKWQEISSPTESAIDFQERPCSIKSLSYLSLPLRVSWFWGTCILLHKSTKVT